MTKIVAAISLAIVFFAAVGEAQTVPREGGHELELWTAGGRGLTGSTSNTGLWSLGARYGWILTRAHGPGFLRGRFEYAVDLVPVFLAAQKTGPTYGFGVDPLALKWNFTPDRKIVPYIDLEGGTLFTRAQVPPGTSHVNFTSSAGLGVHFVHRHFNWSAELRFMHISNSGLASPNPGINTLQLRIGFGRFTRPK